VFCIYGKGWEPDVTSDKLAEIESAFEVVVNERTPELPQFVKEPPQSPEAAALSWAEQIYARIYADFISPRKRLADSVVAVSNVTRDQFLQIDMLSAEFKRTLPDELFVNNFFVHPIRLEELANFFRNEPDIQRWIPPSPYERRSFFRFRFTEIFEKLEEIVLRFGNLRHKYFAPLAVKWMQGKSLKELISEKLEYEQRVDRTFDPVRDVEGLNRLIRSLFDDVEKELRYTYVKYMRIYTDVRCASRSKISRRS
jgi:hypothetical protein